MYNRSAQIDRLAQWSDTYSPGNVRRGLSRRHYVVRRGREIERCGGHRKSGLTAVKRLVKFSRKCSARIPSVTAQTNHSIALQRSLAHSIRARTLRLELSKASLLPHHSAFHFLLRSCILLLVLYSMIGSHICHSLGFVVSLQAHSCNEMGFPSFFNNIQFSLIETKRKYSIYQKTCWLLEIIYPIQLNTCIIHLACFQPSLATTCIFHGSSPHI